MPPDGSSINAVNTPQISIPRQLESFSLYAPPSTDLHRQTPINDTVTAPILYLTPSHPFTGAEVTVSAKWELEWDQAGLVIFTGDVCSSIDQATTPSSAPLHPAALEDRDQDPYEEDQAPPAYSAPSRHSKWVKASLEFTNNALHATSVSATLDGADLAIAPLPPPYYNTHQMQTSAAATIPGRTDLRLKLERIGYALWVWYEDPSPPPYSTELNWKKLREISGFFWGIEDKEIKIGVTASRPANFGMSVWEREHGGAALSQTSAEGSAGEVEGLDGGDPDLTARRGLLVHFEDLEIW
ncbi:hypothetical protein EV356DRAFT_449791 [Viridothelium virens]|uniref:Uncharacterized protein n=1 Tax=Viridothelium virens TaxID=1048519 RepID=A0A6A6H468_VIRVR|nr:hypothetical protein EV356DRAFT_449791 [Viridothelium virens]